jgi:HD-GYP domain-containing protein (c-di-GMP phosphodiesterase class II)
VAPVVGDRGVDRCRLALRAALDAVGAIEGALFSVEPPARVRLIVAQGAPRADRLAAMELAALGGLGVDHDVLTALPTQSGGTSSLVAADDCLVVPAVVDGERIGLIVATGLAAAPRLSLDALSARMLPFTTSISLSIERSLMIDALRRREDDIAALRQQLDVYAMDFRSTYLAERDRSQELAVALTELEQTYRATVRGLAVAVEAKDECTGGHLQRVSRYGMMLTALVAPEHADDPQFEYGFLLHDIGKLTVPDSVLMKPGALNDAEWDLIREHPASGHSILDGIPFLAGAREIVYSHHERWDGKGYPQGLAGPRIPLGAQIFPLCDAFDAMTSDRPYRKALEIDAARDEVAGGAGTQFWPDAVEAFMTIPVHDLDSVRESHGDPR